jgi:hypothetical protein
MPNTLIEIPPENWGVRSGHPDPEVDQRFKIKV